jgi:hypothetical protein
MNKQEIRNHILKTQWESWHKTGHFASLWGSVFPYNVPEQEADNIMEVVRELEDEGYFCLDFNGELTGKGIVYTEEQNLVNAEKVLYHQELRHKILSFLFQLHESKERSEIHITKLAAELNLDIGKLAEEHQVLAELGLVKDSHPSISRKGIEYWKEHLLLESFKNEFSDLANLKGVTPQQRGMALQKLLAKVIDFAGYPTEEGVRRSHEEIDITVEYNGKYYLIECKWEKEKTKSFVIRELYGKIENRSEMRGMCASIAGFTEGAEKQVFEYANKRTIPLFGKEDISQIIHNPKSFKPLMDEKLKRLLIKKEVFWR